MFGGQIWIRLASFLGGLPEIVKNVDRRQTSRHKQTHSIIYSKKVFSIDDGESRRRGENLALDAISCATAPVSNEGRPAKWLKNKNQYNHYRDFETCFGGRTMNKEFSAFAVISIQQFFDCRGVQTSLRCRRNSNRRNRGKKAVARGFR
jgi:hypothetical protein